MKCALFAGSLVTTCMLATLIFSASPPKRALGDDQAAGSQATAGQAVAGAPAADPSELLSEAELEDLVVPIALYPDALVAQILPASTYPLDIVQAARFLRDNDGTADEQTINSLDYDPSILALMHYPDVLQMLNDDLNWTSSLGDAVYSQMSDVMDAIQRVRAQADTAGNLATNEQQTIVRENEIITIVPTNPEVIYVPQYDPQVVVVRQETVVAPVVTFATGVAFGAWLGYGCGWGWGRGRIDVNVNHRGYWGRVRPGWGAGRYWRPASRAGVARRTGRRTARRTAYRGGARPGTRPARRYGGAAGRRTGAVAGGRTGAATRARAGARNRGTAARRSGGGAYGGYRSNSMARQHSRRGSGSRAGARSSQARGRPSASSRRSYGGYRSRSSASRHSARGRSRGGGSRRGGGRRR